MPPRVFHLVYNLIRGGTEGQCARVAMHFAQTGHMHRVGVSVAEGFFLNAVEQACGPVYRMNIRRMLSLQTGWEIRRLAAFLREGGFDLLHAWDADAAIFGSMAARLAGIPWVTSRRDLGQIYAARKLKLIRRADLHAKRVVVNANAIARVLVQEGLPCDRICLIPNLLDIDEVDELSRRPSPVPSTLPPGRRIGMVCRLDPEKDPLLLVRAADIVCRQVDDVLFLLAGEGVCRKPVEEEVRRRGLAERFLCIGEIHDVPAFLKILYAATLVPRSNEGLSNSILEYMAAGLPVVATDCGGNSELVENGKTGWLIPAGDEAALAEALLLLLSAPDEVKEMGRRGRAVVEQRHSPCTVIAKFLALYEETAGSTDPAG